eukprot:SAG31_NODE_33846_length_339_cov_0.912500_1_plen_36_part_10
MPGVNKGSPLAMPPPALLLVLGLLFFGAPTITVRLA